MRFGISSPYLLVFAVFLACSIASAAPTVPADEMTVTARRVEENLQDVPIAVSSFSQNLIQERNMFSLDDLALYTPSLSFSSAFGRQPGSDRATMRGITTILNGAGNASAIATFVDGVFIGATLAFRFGTQGDGRPPRSVAGPVALSGGVVLVTRTRRVGRQVGMGAVGFFVERNPQQQAGPGQVGRMHDRVDFFLIE